MVSEFKRSKLALFVILLLTISAQADEVNKYVRAQLAERHIPGAAIAVIKNGRVVKAEGYGLASVEFNAPATKETVFEIGSISKQMTAAAIMLLVEEGKINLDEKIKRYLPNTPDSWKNVSVRNLLTHTSGIKSYTGLSGFELTKRLKRDEFIKALSTHPLEFEAGANWKYSNSGYNLLGFIIEAVSGKSYWNFMRERIFKPLGMNSTGDRDPQYIIRNRATGYEWENNRLVGRDYDLTDVFSAGAIVSTVMDLAKWDAALRNDSLLKKESKAQIWTPVLFNDRKPYPYGFGWNVTEFRGHRLISHGGQTAGFAANISRYTDDDLTVIVLTNLGDQGLGGAIARGIAKNYIPAISLKTIKAQTESDAKVSTMLKTALRERLENKLNPDLLSSELIKSLSTERAKNVNQRIASFGTIKNLVFVGGETSGERKIYRYKAETPTRIFLWRFAVNDEGKISEMTLEEEE
ncbi:MAG: beta-lactamase family protein [Acidobacteria bacterium]|jgi:CubicO group peptidase (beta-lactamase class C family)|nr:beta-lactamase family protein [Acidobacteriota bacterium]